MCTAKGVQIPPASAWLRGLWQLSSGSVSRKNKTVTSAEGGKGKRNQNFEVHSKGRSETGSFPIRSEPST